MPTPLPVVIGRPTFFGVSVINFAIYLGYHKSKPGGSTNFHPGSNPAERYSQMAKATRVHSTPRRTASKIHTTRKPKAKKLESAVAKVQKAALSLSGPERAAASPPRCAIIKRSISNRGIVPPENPSLFHQMNS